MSERRYPSYVVRAETFDGSQSKDIANTAFTEAVTINIPANQPSSEPLSFLFTGVTFEEHVIINFAAESPTVLVNVTVLNCTFTKTAWDSIPFSVDSADAAQGRLQLTIRKSILAPLHTSGLVDLLDVQDSTTQWILMTKNKCSGSSLIDPLPLEHQNRRCSVQLVNLTLHEPPQQRLFGKPRLLLRMATLNDIVLHRNKVHATDRESRWPRQDSIVLDNVAILPLGTLGPTIAAQQAVIVPSYSHEGQTIIGRQIAAQRLEAANNAAQLFTLQRPTSGIFIRENVVDTPPSRAETIAVNAFSINRIDVVNAPVIVSNNTVLLPEKVDTSCFEYKITIQAHGNSTVVFEEHDVEAPHPVRVSLQVTYKRHASATTIEGHQRRLYMRTVGCRYEFAQLILDNGDLIGSAVASPLVVVDMERSNITRQQFVLQSLNLKQRIHTPLVRFVDGELQGLAIQRCDNVTVVLSNNHMTRSFELNRLSLDEVSNLVRLEVVNNAMSAPEMPTGGSRYDAVLLVRVEVSPIFGRVSIRGNSITSLKDTRNSGITLTQNVKAHHGSTIEVLDNSVDLISKDGTFNSYQIRCILFGNATLALRDVDSKNPNKQEFVISVIPVFVASTAHVLLPGENNEAISAGRLRVELLGSVATKAEIKIKTSTASDAAAFFKPHLDVTVHDSRIRLFWVECVVCNPNQTVVTMSSSISSTNFIEGGIGAVIVKSSRLTYIELKNINGLGHVELINNTLGTLLRRYNRIMFHNINVHSEFPTMMPPAMEGKGAFTERSIAIVNNSMESPTYSSGSSHPEALLVDTCVFRDFSIFLIYGNSVHSKEDTKTSGIVMDKTARIINTPLHVVENMVSISVVDTTVSSFDISPSLEGTSSLCVRIDGRNSGNSLRRIKVLPTLMELTPTTAVMNSTFNPQITVMIVNAKFNTLYVRLHGSYAFLGSHSLLHVHNCVLHRFATGLMQIPLVGSNIGSTIIDQVDFSAMTHLLGHMPAAQFVTNFDQPTLDSFLSTQPQLRASVTFAFNINVPTVQVNGKALGTVIIQNNTFMHTIVTGRHRILVADAILSGDVGGLLRIVGNDVPSSVYTEGVIHPTSIMVQSVRVNGNRSVMGDPLNTPNFTSLIADNFVYDIAPSKTHAIEFRDFIIESNVHVMIANNRFKIPIYKAVHNVLVHVTEVQTAAKLSIILMEANLHDRESSLQLSGTVGGNASRSGQVHVHFSGKGPDESTLISKFMTQISHSGDLIQLDGNMKDRGSSDVLLLRFSMTVANVTINDQLGLDMTPGAPEWRGFDGNLVLNTVLRRWSIAPPAYCTSSPLQTFSIPVWQQISYGDQCVNAVTPPINDFQSLNAFLEKVSLSVVAVRHSFPRSSIMGIVSDDAVVVADVTCPTNWKAALHHGNPTLTPSASLQLTPSSTRSFFKSSVTRSPTSSATMQPSLTLMMSSTLFPFANTATATTTEQSTSVPPTSTADEPTQAPSFPATEPPPTTNEPNVTTIAPTPTPPKKKRSVLLTAVMPEEATAAVTSVGTTSAVATAIVSPTAGAQLARIGATARLATCGVGDTDLDDAPERAEHPVNFAVGSGSLKLYHGAVIFSSILVLISWGGTEIAFKHLRSNAEQNKYDICETEKKKAKPAVLLAVCSTAISAYLIPNIAGTSVFLWANRDQVESTDNTASIAIGLFGLAACVVHLGYHEGWRLNASFGAVSSGAGGHSSGQQSDTTTTATSSSDEDIEMTTVENSNKGRSKSSDQSTTTTATSSSDSAAMNSRKLVLENAEDGSFFVEQFGTLFDGAKSLKSKWIRNYYTVEMVVAVVVSMLIGAQPVLESGERALTRCKGIGGTLILVNLLNLAYLVLARPLRTYLDTIFAFVTALNNVTLGILCYLAVLATERNDFEAQEKHSERAAICLALQFSIFIVQIILQSVWAFLVLQRRKAKATRHGVDEGVHAALDIPLLTDDNDVNDRGDADGGRKRQNNFQNNRKNNRISNKVDTLSSSSSNDDVDVDDTTQLENPLAH